jgi:hypothetical protein
MNWIGTPIRFPPNLSFVFVAYFIRHIFGRHPSYPQRVVSPDFQVKAPGALPRLRGPHGKVAAGLPGIAASEFAISEQLLYRIVKWFRGGLASKACRLVYHPTLGLGVIKDKKKKDKKKQLKSFNVKATARIWPRLSYTSHICSTAVTPVFLQPGIDSRRKAVCPVLTAVHVCVEKSKH